jgi:2-polyprenyl-6-methoxyphenol hydroxylase-like FAD-dependent oxidoreductase
MNWPAGANLAVTIAGGSIGGPCAGVALRGIGADVHIYERVTGPMETRGAGIVVQGDVVQLLRRRFGRLFRTAAITWERRSPMWGSRAVR